MNVPWVLPSQVYPVTPLSLPIPNNNIDHPTITMGTEPPTPSTLTDDNDNNNNKCPADIQSDPPSQIKPDHPTKPTCSHIYIFQCTAVTIQHHLLPFIPHSPSGCATILTPSPTQILIVLSYHAWLVILAPLYPLNPTPLYQMGHCTKHWGHLTCRWGQCDHHTHSCHTCCTSCLSTPQFLIFSLRHTQSMEEPQLSSLLFSPTHPSFMQVIQIPYRHSCTWNPCTIATASTTIASASSAYQNCLTPPWDCANKTCHQDHSTIYCSHAFLYISTFVEDTLGCSLRFIFTAILSLFIGWSADPLPAGLARI